VIVRWKKVEGGGLSCKEVDAGRWS
jgi:hypothetical protein